MTVSQTTDCRFCGAPIRWVVTARGKAMPLDPEPVGGGNVRIVGGYAVVDSAGRPPAGGRPTYMAHFATCPQRPDRPIGTVMPPTR